MIIISLQCRNVFRNVECLNTVNSYRKTRVFLLPVPTNLNNILFLTQQRTRHHKMKEDNQDLGEAMTMLSYEKYQVDDSLLKSEKRKVDPVHLDVALAMTGHGKFHHFLLFITGFCLLEMVFELYITSYLLPAAQCDFNMTSKQKGLLNSISYIGVIASCHMWGFIADTKGRKTALLFSLGLDFICATVSSFAPDYYSFLIIRFFNGFFVFCAGSVVFAYTGEFHGPATRAKAVMLLSGFLAGAALLLPCLAWLIIPQKWSFELPGYTYSSWRIFVLICGLPSLFCCIILYLFVPESPKFLLSQGKQEEVLQVLRHMYRVNTGKSETSYQVESVVNDSFSDDVNKGPNSKNSSVRNVLLTIWNQTVPLFKKPHLPYTVLVCVLQFGIFTCFNSLLLWLPEVFNRMAEFAEHNPGQYATVCEALTGKSWANSSLELAPVNNTRSYLIGSTTTESTYANDGACETNISFVIYLNNIIIGSACVTINVLSGFIVKFGRNIFIFIFSLVTGSCTIALYFVNSADVVLALAAIFVSLNGCSTGFVTLAVVDIFPTSYRAMAMCLALMSGRLGVVVGSMLIGALIDASCDSVFFTMSGIIFVCAGLSTLLPRQRKVS